MQDSDNEQKNGKSKYNSCINLLVLAKLRVSVLTDVYICAYVCISVCVNVCTHVSLHTFVYYFTSQMFISVADSVCFLRLTCIVCHPSTLN